MSRLIKFRAWDKEDRKMYQVAHISNLLTVGTFVSVRKNEDGAVTKIERDLEEGDFDLMQFTGLKDKNGKDVYEGDILHRDADPDHEIIFNRGAFGIETGDGFIPLAELYKFELEEVIGNVYETPELLKEKVPA